MKQLLCNPKKKGIIFFLIIRFETNINICHKNTLKKLNIEQSYYATMTQLRMPKPIYI
jgi:hypothetical protein